MTELEKVDALLAIARKHNYRVGNVHVGVDGVGLSELVPLAPDVEEEAIVEARANRNRDKERNAEDLKLLGVRR